MQDSLAQDLLPEPRQQPLRSIRVAVSFRNAPRSVPARVACLGAAAAAVALGAGAGLLAPLTGGLATPILAGCALGAVSGALFRAAGSRPLPTLGIASLLAPAAGSAALVAGIPREMALPAATAFAAAGAVAIPLCTVALTRGNLFDDLGARWFGAPRPIALMHALGRPLVPRDLRKLVPYSGDHPVVLVVLHHASSRCDGTEVISIVSRRRRARGLLARVLPFTGAEEVVLPPTMITREALELIRRHPGTLG